MREVDGNNTTDPLSGGLLGSNMGELQKQKANETLQQELASIGLMANIDIGSADSPSGIGPGVTSPTSYGVVPAIEQAPRYEEADPDEAVATEPLN